MLEIITGDKGKGKTKVLIEKVNNDVKVVAGSVVFIDNNNKHLTRFMNLPKRLSAKRRPPR